GIPIGLAALLNVREVHAGLRVGPLDHGVQAEVGVTLQRGRAVGEGTEAANRVIQPGIVVVVDDPAVGVGHADLAAVVGAAGHLAIGVLHLRRRARVHAAAGG